CDRSPQRLPPYGSAGSSALQHDDRNDLDLADRRRVSESEACRGIEAFASPQPPRREPSTLLANSAFMLLARGFTLLAGGALAVYAVRTFSVAAYGRYAVAAAIVTIFGLLSEMGISAYALREMSHEDERAGQTV